MRWDYLIWVSKRPYPKFLENHCRNIYICKSYNKAKKCIIDIRLLHPQDAICVAFEDRLGTFDCEKFYKWIYNSCFTNGLSCISKTSKGTKINRDIIEDGIYFNFV
jgi:hypothetical protein